MRHVTCKLLSRPVTFRVESPKAPAILVVFSWARRGRGVEMLDYVDLPANKDGAKMVAGRVDT